MNYLYFAAMIFGLGLGLLNLIFAAIGSTFLSMFSGFVLGCVDDGRLHIRTASFVVFLLAVPGTIAHGIEAALSTGINASLGQMANITMITSASVCVLTFMVLWLKVSGLLRRICAPAANAIDYFEDWVFSGL